MRSRLLLLALATAACGNVHDLSLAASPFATVHGHVDLSSIVAKANGAPLIAGIVWATLPSSHPICFEEPGDPVLAADCPDPFGVFPGIVDANVQLDPNGDGHFDLPLTHLPSANALIGTDVSHVAYGTLVVVADTDGNGQLTIVTPRVGRGGGGGFGGGGGETTSSSADGGTSTPSLSFGADISDKVLAASFFSLKQDQERLSFREGDFGALKLFEPAPSCGTPPSGYSILNTGPYTDTTATCETFGLDQTIELDTLSDADSQAFSCRARSISSRTRQPSQAMQPKNIEGLTSHCIGKDILLLVSDGTCPSFNVFALSGCQSDPKCDKPEWDERANPPGWWPCGQ